MADEDEKLELTSGQKTQLLNLALGVPSKEQSADEQRADMLYDILKRPLPRASSVCDKLPAPLKTVSLRLRSLAGIPLKELLLSGDTDLATLKEIKEYAKKQGSNRDNQPTTDVFLAVYYAAIAAALFFQSSKISEHTDEHLCNAFDSLANRTWINQRLSNLFENARRSFT